MTSVICAKQALVAQAQLQTWAANWNGTRPGAAASVREGLEETLTVLHLVYRAPWPAPCAAPTASYFVAATSRNVKRYRWHCVGVRRAWWKPASSSAGSNGQLHLRALRTALERHVAAETSEPTSTITPATPPMITGPPPALPQTMLARALDAAAPARGCPPGEVCGACGCCNPGY